MPLKRIAAVITAIVAVGGIVQMPIIQNIITDSTLNASADYYGDFEYSIVKIIDTP